ncbi:MAG: class I SAM-dependent methyltransferase [Candidatus Omnitrophica bacterium]|nr:class I SAM-dependent methyltransferase [Candidatus Omnitrophota bacterium]MBU1808349.1 class I SAM-dependent methyltransferase [Candidatus Omnitrophota bacterium]
MKMSIKHTYKRSVKKGGFTVINCLACGFWHVYPVPSENELSAYYQNKYYQNIQDNRSMSDKLADLDDFYQIQYGDRLRRIEKTLLSTLPKTILDIGSGYGDFLRYSNKKGWDVQGVEPSRYAYESITDHKQLNIKCGSVEDLDKLDLASASVVTLNNVLEHVRDPISVLRIIKDKLLLPGGVLCLIVPNDFSILQHILTKTVLRRSPQKHFYWVAPLDHLNYWSVHSMKRFLNNNGLKVMSTTTDFPMEVFPLAGFNYIDNPEIGRRAHLARVKFEKYLYRKGYFGIKDSIFTALAHIGVGRDVQICAKVG